MPLEKPTSNLSPPGSPPAGAADDDQLIVAASRLRPGQRVIRFFGEVDRLTVGRFEAALEQAVKAATAEPAETAQHGAVRETASEALVVCDLSGVEFLSVAAMTTLLRIDAVAAVHHVRWAVLVDSRVRRVLEIAALDRTLPLAATTSSRIPVARAVSAAPNAPGLPAVS